MTFSGVCKIIRGLGGEGGGGEGKGDNPSEAGY